MLSAIGLELGDTERITNRDIPEVIERNGWSSARKYQGTRAPHKDPSLVFVALKSGNISGTECKNLLNKCPDGTSPTLVSSMTGIGGRVIHWAENNLNQVCRERHQFETLYGCPHGCVYCTGGTVAVVFTNLEEFVALHVDPVVRENEWQKVFMFNSCLSDTLCFEPEYGLTELLTKYFADTKDRFQLIHTKSANVDFLTKLDHGGHTIILWSLTSDTVSRVLEPNSATTSERIEAARKCHEAGYPVRLKFKPIVPVRGWRDECRKMIEEALTHIRPDNISMCMLAWMELDMLKSIMDPAIIDPDFLRAAEESSEALKGCSEGPFPHESRAQVYRFYLDEIRKHAKDVPVALCTETPQMWREFTPLLGFGPGEYVCGCGPQCVPGMKKLEKLITVS